jgi:hypothetical protein
MVAHHVSISHSHILRAAFVQIFLRQKSTNLKVSFKKLLAKLLYEKAAHKMLVKLATWFKFWLVSFKPHLSYLLLFCQHRWKNFDFESRRLQNLAKGLAPAYLRLGGTDADFTVFEETCDDVDLKNNR